MKVFVCGDVHWCSTSSIVRGSGEKYSQRLENLIRTINWVESTAEENCCNLIIYLGDFFDKSLLDSQEIAALNEINWSGISKYFLVGNHEIGRSDRLFSTAHLFNFCGEMRVIDTPEENFLGGKKALFLPYFLEKDRKSIEEDYDYIFSHNDIKGLQLGKFITETGYEIKNIEDHCKFFINGHIHNSMLIGDHIINLGNISGQNFSEDGTTYSHIAMVLDTKTDDIKFLENPYAFNFYKLGLVNSVNELPAFKNNSVISITVDINNNELRDFLESNPNIVCKRVLFQETTTDKEYDDKFEAVDYLDKFVQFVKDNMEMTDIVKQELSEVIA